MELSTKAERLKIEREKMKVKSLFHEMERNILNKLSKGEVPGGLHFSHTRNENPLNNQGAIQLHSSSTHSAKCYPPFYEKGTSESFANSANIEGKCIYGINKEELNSANKITMHEDIFDKKVKNMLQAGVSPDQVANFPNNKNDWNYVRGSQMNYNADGLLDEGIEISHDSGGNVVTSHVCRIPERMSVYSASSELGSKMTIKVRFQDVQ